MWAWIIGAGGKFLLWGAIILGVLGTIAAVLAGAKRAGKMQERAEQLEKINDAANDLAKREAADSGLAGDDLRKRVREQRDKLRGVLRSRQADNP